jgi:hypothetical protein
VLWDQLLQEAVGRSPTSSPSSIAMSASLEFLGDQLIGKDGEKPLLISDIEMQEVMYKFESSQILHYARMFANSSEWVEVVLLMGYANYGEQLVGHLCMITYFQAKERREMW